MLIHGVQQRRYQPHNTAGKRLANADVSVLQGCAHAHKLRVAPQHVDLRRAPRRPERARHGAGGKYAAGNIRRCLVAGEQIIMLETREDIDTKKADFQIGGTRNNKK